MKRVLPNVLILVLFITAQVFGNVMNKIPSEEPCMDCLTAPVLICPSTFMGCPSDNLDPSNTGFPTALPGDSNCPEPIVTYTDQIVQNSNCLTIIHRTWKAEYPPNSASIKLHSQCQQTLYLEDLEAPVIENCPGDLTVDLADNCAGIATWSLPVATDDCGIQLFLTTHYSGTAFPLGVTPVTYTAQDYCTRLDTCTFNVTVQGSCCNGFSISCPSDLNICIGSSTDPSNTGSLVVTSADPSCPSPTVSYQDSIVNNSSCAQAQTILRTWTAIDPDDSNIQQTCLQTIILEDSQNPIIQNIPQDLTVDATNSICQVPVNWTTPTVSDNCGVASFTSNIANGSAFDLGSTLVTYSATDNCGNTATAAFQVTVTCSGAACSSDPLISCPSDFSGCYSTTAPNPSLSGFATASSTDPNCGTPVVSYVDFLVSSTSCSQVIQRTWTASDPSDATLVASCVQTLTLSDDQAPVITSIPSDITVTGFGNNCQVPVTWTEPQYSDNCGISTWSSNIPNGSTLNQGVTQVIYTAVDACGQSSSASFNITVNCISSCNTPPSISCPANYWACPVGSIPGPDVSGTAIANAGSVDCTAPVLGFNDLIISTGPCVGSKIIERTWVANDPNNPQLQSSCVQTISLEDASAPTFIYCPQNVHVNATGTNCSTPVSWSSVLATDNCGSPNLYATDQYGNSVINGGNFNQGTTHVTYTATDNCGNQAQCQFNVSVSCVATCTTPPNIYCPSNITVCPGSNIDPYVIGSATASSSQYCPNPVLTYQDIITSTGSCLGEKTVHRTYTAYYPNTNLSSSCVQVINLKDDLPPVLSNCPSNITVQSTNTPVTWSAPYASDFCSNPHVSSNYNSGQYFPIGTTQVVYNAFDACNNYASCSFNVTVMHDNSATITCPNDLYLTCNDQGGAYATWEDPLYEGSCQNCNNNNSIPGFVYMGTLNGSQYYCSTSVASWQNANQICQNNGGHLVSINSQEENYFLANILTLQSAWIGLSDFNSEGNFSWSNGDELGYTNWYPGQPNNYNYSQDYVELLNDGRWNDQYNNYSLEFIMELPCDNIRQVSGPSKGSFLTGGTYTVEYELTDACGANSSCSFDIFVDGGISIQCPQNILASAESNSNGVVVSWNDPQVNTCCSSGCNGTDGGPIQGFVYMGQLNGHHYYCSTQIAYWEDAQTVCEYNGGYLAVINDAEENQYLANLLTLQSAWIGLTDREVEGEFHWVNGDELSYTNWYPSQPNNYNGFQDYVQLLNTGLWNDHNNNDRLEYIMEIPACNNINQIAGPTSGSLLPPGSIHTVTYQATDGCGNSASCSFTIEVESVTTNNGFCEARGINSDVHFIDSVVFGEMVNFNGSNGGYEDFTYKCGDFEEGQTYPLQLTPGFGPTVTDKKVFWKVWIDYNNDKDFDDDLEYVAYGCSENTLSGQITLPDVLLSGESRMRIIMNAERYPESPCDVFENGEVEDYCLKISGSGKSKAIDLVSKRSNSEDAIELTISENKEYDFQVYPNPAVDHINISSDDLSQISSAVLINVSGQVIKNITKIDINNRYISVENVPTGMVFLKVNFTDGTHKMKKILIQK